MELNLNSKNAPHINSESLLLNEEVKRGKETTNMISSQNVILHYIRIFDDDCQITFIESISTKGTKNQTYLEFGNMYFSCSRIFLYTIY